MKLYRTLLLLSILITSCSSDDNNNSQETGIDTEINISFSGMDIETINFESPNVNLLQPCETLEFGTNVALQSGSINISYFLIQFGDVRQFQESNPGTLYTYNGANVNLIAAQAEINSELYISSSLLFEISSEPYQESNCGDFFGQIFKINFTITLESSNPNLNPITFTGSIIDFPIECTSAC